MGSGGNLGSNSDVSKAISSIAGDIWGNKDNSAPYSQVSTQKPTFDAYTKPSPQPPSLGGGMNQFTGIGDINSQADGFRQRSDAYMRPPNSQTSSSKAGGK